MRVASPWFLLVGAVAACTPRRQDTSLEPAPDTDGETAEPDGPGPPRPIHCDLEAMVAAVDQDRYEALLEDIAIPRDHGGDGWQYVQDRCAEELESYGLVVEREVFADGVNVVGRLPGRVPQEVILSGHYDGVDGCPAADDNASGVAASLEAARVLAEGGYEAELVVACWDAEEQGLLGSREYASTAWDTDQEILVAFSSDMVGYASDTPGSQGTPTGLEGLFPEMAAQIAANDYRADFIGVFGDEHAAGAVAAFQAGAAAEGLPAYGGTLDDDTLRSVYTTVTLLRRSDHSSFWRYGYPAVMVTDLGTLRDDAYHCLASQDTPDRLDPAFTTSVIRALVTGAAAALGCEAGEETP